MKTTEGLLEVGSSQPKAREQPFRIRLASALKDSSDIAGRLVSKIHLRGLSTRDVKSMFIKGVYN